MTADDDQSLIKLAFEMGSAFCREQASRWWRNEWNQPEDARQSQQQHWRANAERMKELSNELRKNR